MDIFSYVVTRDYGFAPNPFYGCCTLATCKPNIRKSASVGDVVIGCTSREMARKSGYNGFLYAMIVDEKLTFDEYWNDIRFECKKPILNGSLKQFYGDNIYHSVDGTTIQENSHHSNEDGSINYSNYNRDTSGKYVLCAKKYWYWGRKPLEVPQEFSMVFHKNIGHRRIKAEDNSELIRKFLDWLNSLPEEGIIDFPMKLETGFIRYGGN